MIKSRRFWRLFILPILPPPKVIMLQEIKNYIFFRSFIFWSKQKIF